MTRPTLTREDWILAAQNVLVDSGVDAVRVDVLAKAFSITRGSFYYHFKSRSELLEGILSSWRARATENVINDLSQAQTSPRQSLERLLELPHHGQTAKDAAAIELGIRAWARRDLKARQAIDEVDRYRLSYIENLLLQVSVDKSEAKDRAYLIYAYQQSLSLIHVEESPAELKKRNARMVMLLIPQLEAVEA
jgi:AcrR family transcriptional regulator